MNPLDPEALEHCLDTAHSAPVWYGHDEGAFWVITGTHQRETKNLQPESGPGVTPGRGRSIGSSPGRAGPRAWIDDLESTTGA